MVAILKPSAEYNRRAAIIEDLRAGHLATEIIRFVMAKYGFRTVRTKVPVSARKKERIARIPAVERAQTLISNDPEQSL